MAFPRSISPSILTEAPAASAHGRSAEKESDGEEGAQVLIGFHELDRCLGCTLDIHSLQQGARHHDTKDRNEDGEEGADGSLKFPPRDILLLESFIDDGALLEEDHPRSDGRADICHEEEEELPAEATWEVWDHPLMDDV